MENYSIMIDLLAMTITCIFLLVVTKRKLITRFIIIASLHIISSKTKPSGRIEGIVSSRSHQIYKCTNDKLIPALNLLSKYLIINSRAHFLKKRLERTIAEALFPPVMSTKYV